jgi:hypothetical protein
MTDTHYDAATDTLHIAGRQYEPICYVDTGSGEIPVFDTNGNDPRKIMLALYRALAREEQ